MSERESTGEKGSCLSTADELKSLGAMCRQTVLALCATYKDLSDLDRLSARVADTKGAIIA